MKHIKCAIICFFSLFLFNGIANSQAIGQWDTYFSYEADITSICDGKDVVYAVSDGKLFMYYPDDASTEKAVKLNLGNDDVTLISYNNNTEKLFIFRSNFDIDLLDKAGNFTNIPYLKNVAININKNINQVSMEGDLAYLSGDFGLMVIDMSRNEIKETCIFNYAFHATCVNGNTLYAVTDQGLKTVDLTQNIQEPANWQTFTLSDKNPNSDLIFSDTDIRGITFFKDKLHILVPYNAIYYLDGNSLVRTLSYEPASWILSDKSRLIAYNSDAFFNITDLGVAQKVFTNTGDGQKIASIAPKENSSQYWLGLSDKHLCIGNVRDTSTQNIELVAENIRPNGPGANFTFFLNHDGEKLIYVGGGYWLNRYTYPGLLSTYKDISWYNYDMAPLNEVLKDSIPLGVRDFTMAISDPRDKSRIFVSSWGEGLYEFKDSKFVAIHRNFTPMIEETVEHQYRRLSGLAYDKNNNLWITNTAVSDFITVYTPDGQWLKPDYSSLPTINMAGSQAAKRIIIDRYNRKWAVTMRRPSSLLVIDDNNTIANPKDDKIIYQDTFSDQDYNTLDLYAINDIVEDLNGDIWFATTRGPFVIYNSSNIFNRTSLTLNKIKIPRNDGTNNADILLESVIINSIVIDGANRKWIGTETSGVYLVSSNGLETIHSFNTSNSPLPSNNVLSVTIDSSTGVVYFGTEKGIVSYKSDAIDGKSDFSDVYAYPNPVRPDYDGIITIYGLQSNSTVKITDIKGNIINTGTSIGGQYTWDGKNRNRDRVDTGTYLVFGATADGKSGVVTKVLVINN